MTNLRQGREADLRCRGIETWGLPQSWR